jgi:uncharacterized Zn-finger protein
MVRRTRHGYHRPVLRQRGKEMSQTMLKPIEVEQVNTHVVSCEGTSGQLGHPKVFLRLPQMLGGPAQAVCPYCSRLFILSGDALAEGH